MLELICIRCFLVIVINIPSTAGQTRDIGTELYMAPELFRVDDNEPYSSKIDIFRFEIF